MKKLLLASAALLLGVAPALALNDTIGVTVGAGKTANLIKFGSGNVISETGLCDATTENRCVTVSVGGAVLIDGTATTQPVSAASLPLPTGAATAANQATEITSLSTIATNTGLGALVDEAALTEGSSSSITIGGYYKAAPAALTTGQSGALTMTQGRALIVSPYGDCANFCVSGVTAAMTGTTSTSLIAAPAGSLHNYVTHLICTNSHATVGTFVLVQDGSGGTTIYEGYAAPAGGGFSIPLPAPLRQPTAATALFVQDVTTGANVICSGSGVKAL